MKITYYDDTKIAFEDELEKYVFINLYKLGYEDLVFPSNEWHLYQYNKKIEGYENLELTVSATFRPNGNIYELSFGYFINKIIRRTLKFNEEGRVEKDSIMLFDPQNCYNVSEYKALVPHNISLDDYLEEIGENEKRVFENKYYDEKIRNNIVPDSIIVDYIEKDAFYSYYLNIFSNDSNKIKEIAERFKDEDYFYFLRSEASRKKKNNE